VTVWVHGQAEYEKALKASQILFGQSTTEDLVSLDEELFLQIFDGVLKKTLQNQKLLEAISLI
jgi:tyrosyl-tRNA synthetase